MAAVVCQALMAQMRVSQHVRMNPIKNPDTPPISSIPDFPDIAIDPDIARRMGSRKIKAHAREKRHPVRTVLPCGHPSDSGFDSGHPS